jgi:hypothetical protein
MKAYGYGYGIPFNRVLGGSFTPEYTAILDRATALGYTLPSAGQQVKQNALIVALKAAGIWAKLDVFYVYANNGSQEFGTLNWINPTLYQCTLVNSPTFTANEGFAGNGTSSYIDTNFNPLINGLNYQLDNASRYYYLNSLGPSAQVIEGVINNAQNGTQIGTSTSQRINQGTNVLNSAASLGALGVNGINRTSNTNVEIFNSTTQISRTATSTSINSNNQFILRAGTAGYSTSQISFYSMGASLVSENTDFVNSFNTYLAAL